MAIIKQRAPFLSNPRLRKWLIYCLLFLQSLMLTISPTRALDQEPLTDSIVLERTLRSTKDYKRILKVDSHYLSIVDDRPAVPHREIFASIRENGKLDLSHKPKDEIRIRPIDPNQLLLLISDKSKCWYLCLDGNEASTKKLNIEENTPMECVWKLDIESWRVRPSQDTNTNIQFGLYTRNYRSVLLYLRDDVRNIISPNTPECHNVRRRLRRLALEELKKAARVLGKIRIIRKEIQEQAEEQASAISNLIDELIHIHFKLEMLKWDRDGIFANDKSEFTGFSGTYYRIPSDDRNFSALFTPIMDQEMHLKEGEKRVIRKIFARTMKMRVWDVKFKRAYMKKPSFSNILRGLSLLSEDEVDIEPQLYLINRYLPRDFSSGALPPVQEFTLELQDRAALLKLEEIIMRQNNNYFVRKLSCLEDMTKDLPRRSTKNNA